MSQFNEKNLRLLADFLNTQVAEEDFNMRHFRSTHKGEMVNFKSKNECGTVGCALGYAPFVEGLPDADEILKEVINYIPPPPLRNPFTLEAYFWKAYSLKAFGFSDENEDEWNWCFSDMWTAVDNTPKGAAKRIYYLLNNKFPLGNIPDAHSLKDTLLNWVTEYDT